MAALFQASAAFISYSTNCCTRSKSAARELSHIVERQEAKEGEDGGKEEEKEKRKRRGKIEEEDKGEKEH